MTSTPPPVTPARRRGRPGRLSPEQVRGLLEATRRGLSDAEAGALYGVSKTLARRIRSGERYKHVDRTAATETKEQDT